MEQNILVLEASTTSAKAMVYGAESGIQCMAAEAYLPGTGGETQDADAVFALLMKLGREAAAGRNIDAVSLGGTWHNLLVCGEDMRPLGRAYTWQWMDARGLTEELRRDAVQARQLYEKTGCMVHALYPVYKLRYLKEQGTDLRNARIFGQGSYNFFRLTGKRWVSASMLSGSGFLNIREQKIDPEMLELAGIPREALGREVTFLDTAPLTQEGAGLLGLKSGLPVVPTHPDGALNQVGALRDGAMTLSVGTSAALRLSQPKAHTAYEKGLWCYLSPVSWLLGAATSGACNCVDWAKASLFSGTVSYSELSDAAVDREHLPYFLPFLFGERCPGWQDGRLGGFAQVRPGHTSLELYHSVLEGVLFNIRQCMDGLTEEAGEPREILVSGGILKSPVWLKMLANILERPVRPDLGEQASLVGGALLGKKVLQPDFDLQEYGAPVGEALEPDEDAEIYRRRYREYLEIYRQSV